MDIHPAILLSNRKIREEAEAMLYQSYDFDFNRDVFGAVPLLRSLLPTARHNIKCITMKLVVLSGEDGGKFWYEEYKAHENEDDWSKACSYIAKNVRPQNLAFSVHEAITKEFEDLAWVQELVQIKGISDVSQREILGRPLEALPWIYENGLPVTRSDSRRDELMRARWRALLSYSRLEMLKP